MEYYEEKTDDKEETARTLEGPLATLLSDANPVAGEHGLHFTGHTRLQSSGELWKGLSPSGIGKRAFSKTQIDSRPLTDSFVVSGDSNGGENKN